MGSLLAIYCGIFIYLLSLNFFIQTAHAIPTSCKKFLKLAFGNLGQLVWPPRCSCHLEGAIFKYRIQGTHPEVIEDTDGDAASDTGTSDTGMSNLKTEAEAERARLRV